MSSENIGKPHLVSHNISVSCILGAPKNTLKLLELVKSWGHLLGHPVNNNRSKFKSKYLLQVSVDADGKVQGLPEDWLIALKQDKDNKDIYDFVKVTLSWNTHLLRINLSVSFKDHKRDLPVSDVEQDGAKAADIDYDNAIESLNTLSKTLSTRKPSRNKQSANPGHYEKRLSMSTFFVPLPSDRENKSKRKQSSPGSSKGSVKSSTMSSAKLRHIPEDGNNFQTFDRTTLMSEAQIVNIMRDACNPHSFKSQYSKEAMLFYSCQV